MGQRYRKMEDQKQKPGLPCNQDFAKEGQNLNQNLKSFQKIVNWERWRVKWCIFMFHILGSEGKAASRWAIFCNALEKHCYSKAIWITFCTSVEN